MFGFGQTFSNALHIGKGQWTNIRAESIAKKYDLHPILQSTQRKGCIIQVDAANLRGGNHRVIGSAAKYN